MSVRKRQWTTRKGEVKEAWIVDYVDSDGDRHIETFGRKKDADSWAHEVGVAVKEGTHTAKSKSPTVREAADDWIDHCIAEERERSTIHQYKNHAKHISDRLGDIRLGQL